MRWVLATGARTATAQPSPWGHLLGWALVFAFTAIAINAGIHAAKSGQAPLHRRLDAAAAAAAVLPAVILLAVLGHLSPVVAVIGSVVAAVSLVVLVWMHPEEPVKAVG